MKKILVLGLLSVFCLNDDVNAIVGVAASSQAQKEIRIEVRENENDARRMKSLTEVKVGSVYELWASQLNEQDTEAFLTVLSCGGKETAANTGPTVEGLSPEQQKLQKLHKIASAKLKKVHLDRCEINDKTLPILIDAIKNTPSMASFNCYHENVSPKGALKLLRTLIESPVLTWSYVESCNKFGRIAAKFYGLVSVRDNKLRQLRDYIERGSEYALENYRQDEKQEEAMIADLNAEITAAENMIDTISGYQESLTKLTSLALDATKQYTGEERDDIKKLLDDIKKLQDMESFWKPVNDRLPNMRANIEKRLRETMSEKGYKVRMLKFSRFYGSEHSKCSDFKGIMEKIQKELEAEAGRLQVKLQGKVDDWQTGPEAQLDKRLMESDKKIAEMIKEGLEKLAKNLPKKDEKTAKVIKGGLEELAENSAKKDEETVEVVKDGVEESAENSAKKDKKNDKKIDTSDLIVSITKPFNTEMYEQCKIIQDYVYAECDKQKEIIEKAVLELNNKIDNAVVGSNKKVEAGSLDENGTLRIGILSADDALQKKKSEAQAKDDEESIRKLDLKLDELDEARKEVQSKLSEWRDLSIAAVEKIEEEALLKIISLQSDLEEAICGYQMKMWVK